MKTVLEPLLTNQVSNPFGSHVYRLVNHGRTSQRFEYFVQNPDPKELNKLRTRIIFFLKFGNRKYCPMT